MRKTIVLLSLVLILAAAALPEDIFDSLRKGDIPAVKALVEKTPQLVDARDGDGMTPLHYAANGRDAGLINFLIDKGAKLELRNAKQKTPLHIAAMSDRREAAEALIKRGAALEAKDDYGRTALILCARERGQAALGRLLIAAGADINVVDKFGDSALSLAAWRGKGQFVDLLLEKGAKVPGRLVRGPADRPRCQRAQHALGVFPRPGAESLFRRRGAGQPRHG
jgi:ankyrin repeat protein